jgi:hypothetical protein
MTAKFFIVLGCAALLSACETTSTSGKGNQEAKRLAALEQQKRQAPLDESHTNLWRAQENLVDRDGNPMRNY